MSITLSLGSWTVPALVTVVVMALAAFIAWRDSRGGGDYSIPIIGFAAVVAGVVASLVAWGVFFALKFFN